MGQHTTTSERIDELPLLIYWLKQMRVDVIIDSVLGPPHGNWAGLSYGEVALVFITHVVMRCTHFLSPVEEWAAQHLTSLSQALGKPVRAQDCTDDRLAVVLSKLGEEQTQPGDAVEAALGQHLIRAYALPTETARIDLTTVSVHHQLQEEEGLMRFGYSKDHRPDLRQFKAMLGTLDPVGLPLATATLSGEQADDLQYLPAWERLVATIGQPDFLAVGDCKLASLENRARIHQGGGGYLTPLPMTGQTPAELQAWVLKPPVSPQAIRLPGQAAHEAPVGQGFEVAVACRWQDPHTRAVVTWTERRLVVQSAAQARTQHAGLHERLAKAQVALSALTAKPASDRAEVETRAQAIVTRYRVSDYLGLSFRERVTRHTCHVGRGRPGPHRPTQLRETHTWTVCVHRRPAAIALCERLAGWRVYVTNTPAQRLSVAGAVNCYRQQWQPEHGFQRLKGGLLAITPLFLRDEDRIRGLLVLLGIALRVLTLTEFVARRDLATTAEKLTGLYAGNPNRATSQPTAERLVKAFAPITLYRHDTDTAVWYEVTPLSPLQRRILHALAVPESVYAPPAAPLIHSG
jgi:transposase